MSDCELAYSSFDMPTRIFIKNRGALAQENTFHPTQKPVALYKWLLANYAKKGDKILDTHAGSASSIIACIELGFKFMGFEIDAGYYEKAQARIDMTRAQTRIDVDAVTGKCEQLKIDAI